MCGITGFSWKDPSLIKKMTSAIKHRGPDDSGFYTDANVSLGHRRLSIIDLSKKGHQPMEDSTKSLVMTFNGEIWNYKEIRNELIKKGYTFKSSSDTEVVIEAYKEYGNKAFEILEGMFALAIWDKKNKVLTLARDQMGKKPLYYSIENKEIIFSSEIKAILECNGVKREIDNDSLSNYLTLRFSPENKTLFKGIKKVPIGNYAVFKSGNLTLIDYRKNKIFPTKPDKEVADKLISKAIEKRLMSDVPIGIFLSGGLDSSTLVAKVSKSVKDLKTFSISFNSQVDESKYANEVAKKFKTNHKNIKVNEDMLKFLPEAVYYLDEPLADPAILPTYILCKEVSKHVKVAMSGEGGDEVFGGYDNFNNLNKLRIIYKIPYFIRKNIISPTLSIISKFYKYPKKHLFMAISEISKQENMANGFKELFYFPFNCEEKRLLFKEFKEPDQFDKVFIKHKKIKSFINDYYFNEWLPNDLLMKADKMSMSHGLEIRTPYLDKDLVNYFLGLDYKERYKRKLFREVVSDILPPNILKRKKQGFVLPINEWFSNEKTIRRISPFIEKLSNRGIFNRDYVLSILQNPTNFKAEHKLWVLLNFEIWYEIFIEDKDPKKIKI